MKKLLVLVPGICSATCMHPTGRKIPMEMRQKELCFGDLLICRGHLPGGISRKQNGGIRRKVVYCDWLDLFETCVYKELL